MRQRAATSNSTSRQDGAANAPPAGVVAAIRHVHRVPPAFDRGTGGAASRRTESTTCSRGFAGLAKASAIPAEHVVRAIAPVVARPAALTSRGAAGPAWFAGAHAVVLAAIRQLFRTAEGAGAFAPRASDEAGAAATARVSVAPGPAGTTTAAAPDVAAIGEGGWNRELNGRASRQPVAIARAGTASASAIASRAAVASGAHDVRMVVDADR